MFQKSIFLEDQVKKGIVDLRTIRQNYNSFASGDASDIRLDNLPDNSLQKRYEMDNYVEKIPNYHYRFGQTKNKEKEFAEVMAPIFKKVLKDNNVSTNLTNDIVRQAAYESTYGLDARGSQGYNMGGIKHPGNSVAPSYKKTRHTDNYDYIDFDDLYDYANYKIKLLKNRYEIEEATNTTQFVDKLHKNNKAKKSYSENREGYMKTLNNMTTLNKYLPK